jgi:hypothetical protein
MTRRLALCALLAALAPGCSHARTAVVTCDGLPVIRFSEHLCRRLGADTKHITLRARHRTHIAARQWVQLVCMESRRRWRAQITAVRHTSWRKITDRELSDDGFSDRSALLPVMRRYYPGIAADDPATVYRWDRNRACGSVHPPGPLTSGRKEGK